MKRVVLLLAVLLSGPVFAADMVYREGRSTLRLQDAPCQVPEVLALLDEEDKKIARAAVARHAGKSFQGCWLTEGAWVLIHYDDGDMGRVRISSFVSDPAV